MPAAEQSPTNYVLACVSDHPRMMTLLRMARRHAISLGMPWVALHINTPLGPADSDDDAPLRVLQSMTIAEQMGAQTQQIDAKSVLGGIKDYIAQQKRQGITFKAVFVGSTIKDTWWQRRLTTIYTRLIRTLGRGTEVINVPLEVAPILRRSWLARIVRIWSNQIKPRDIVYALLAVAVATGIIEFITLVLPEALSLQTRNMAIIYMAACAFVASRCGFLAAMTAGVTSFLLFNLLYVSPYVRLLFNDASDALNFALFVGAAAVISIFCSSSHEQADRMASQVAQLRGLFRINRTALRKYSRHRMLEALHLEIKNITHTEVSFFLPSAMGPPSADISYPSGLGLRPDERTALAVCWEEARVTGYGTPVNALSRYRFKPLMGSNDLIGVIGFQCENTEMSLSTLQVFNAVAELVALILERLELTTLMEEGRLREEREKLRAMLLSSISHDLKTPLASVIGGLSVLRSMADRLPQAQRETLLETALEEAQRLDSFISNILEMTRLESGQIVFRKEWSNLSQVVTSVVRRMRSRTHGAQIVTDVNSLPCIEVQTDTIMAEQILQNLLDNAIKYTPPGTQIDIAWQSTDAGVQLTVRDYGPGIPEDQIDKIFDKYTRLAHQDRKVAGTGLGLAIARTTMRMQGGDVRAHNHPDGGAVFTVIFPVWRNLAAQVA